MFQKGNKLSAGFAKPGAPMRKAFSEAVRDLMAKPLNADRPENWPKDDKDFTEAQDLAMKTFMAARAGVLRGEFAALEILVNRSEGKLPMAPEDREAQTQLGNALLAGVPALAALQMALGLRREITDVIEGETIDTPALPEATDGT